MLKPRSQRGRIWSDADDEYIIAHHKTKTILEFANHFDTPVSDITRHLRAIGVRYESLGWHIRQSMQRSRERSHRKRLTKKRIRAIIEQVKERK